MFGWFKTKAAHEFGQNLAAFFFMRFPPDKLPLETKKLNEKFLACLKNMSTQVQNFTKTERLNIFQKAKMANAFKWALLDKGYDKSFVDDLTQELIKFTW